jgi:hypothetical protein
MFELLTGAPLNSSQRSHNMNYLFSQSSLAMKCDQISDFMCATEGTVYDFGMKVVRCVVNSPRTQRGGGGNADS